MKKRPCREIVTSDLERERVALNLAEELQHVMFAGLPILVFDPATKALKRVVSVGRNGCALQLWLED